METTNICNSINIFFFSVKEFTICKNDDETCMKSTATAIIQAGLAPNGIPSIGMPSLNPLRINEISVKQDPDSPVNVEIIMKNVDLTGFENSKFIKLR